VAAPERHSTPDTQSSHPTPSTLHPVPYALHPNFLTPCSLTPDPKTLHPESQSLALCRYEAWRPLKDTRSDHRLGIEGEELGFRIESLSFGCEISGCMIQGVRTLCRYEAWRPLKDTRSEQGVKIFSITVPRKDHRVKKFSTLNTNPSTIDPNADTRRGGP